MEIARIRIPANNFTVLTSSSKTVPMRPCKFYTRDVDNIAVLINMQIEKKLIINNVRYQYRDVKDILLLKSISLCKNITT